MEKGEKFQKEKIGKPECINKNCWLVKSLNYAPYKRCQYCELKFHDCLFLHYQIISLILISLSFLLSFLIKGKISELVVISVFSLVIVYGYFFNKSTDKIIQAYSAQRKAREDLEKLTETLQEKVDEQTKAIKDAYKKVKKAYEVEKQAHKQLQKLDEAKTLFLNIASHQLRTPLSGIRGFLSMILDGDFGDVSAKIRNILSELYANNNRLIRMVNSLLNASRIESGRLSVLKAECDVVPLVQRIINEIQFEARDRGLTLSLETSHPKIIANIDADKIEDVLVNLIDNGIKYTAKGSVKVRALDQKDKVRFEIEDTGQGLTESEIKELFNKFVRGERANMLHTDGTGIGLYIAKQIVKLHNGEIGIISEGVDKGSVFWFEVPKGEG